MTLFAIVENTNIMELINAKLEGHYNGAKTLNMALLTTLPPNPQISYKTDAIFLVDNDRQSLTEKKSSNREIQLFFLERRKYKL